MPYPIPIPLSKLFDFAKIHENRFLKEHKKAMGMFDTIFAALDCPFCGRQYRHAPLPLEQAVREIAESKRHHLESRRKYLQAGEQQFYLEDMWARQAGFDDVDAWIEQLDAPEHIEAHRNRRYLGLAEIQTKEFENVMDDFYVGDEVPKYAGHYFIPESFRCLGCSTADEWVYVKVWLEIETRNLKAVHVHDPETGQPDRELRRRVPLEALPPNPWPPLHFSHRGLQAHAKHNPETGLYDLDVHHMPERFRFSHSDGELLRALFTSFADDYLYLLGKGAGESNLHAHLLTICRHLPSDFEPYGQRERNGPDCSAGCLHFLKLPGSLGLDWGVCGHAASPRAGLLTFEHQGCAQFQPAS